MPDNVIRTSMDVGVAKVRRRTTASSRPVSGTLKLNYEQAQLLETFYLETLVSGSVPFDMRDPRTGGLYTFRFTEPPSIRPLTPRTATGGAYFAATVNLERIPSVPTVACYTLDGTQGVHVFCENTAVTLRLRAGRVAAEGIDQLSVPVDRVCTFESITGSAADPEAVTFSYTNADGTTSATFHRDDGWSYSPDVDHVNQPGGTGGTVVVPTAADETDAPFFRPKDEADPAGSALCNPDDTLGQFVLADATVAEGDAPIPASVASGFKHWYAVCGTAAVCHLLNGVLGQFQFCEDSSLEVEFMSGRFIDTDADTQHDAIDITFPLVRVAPFVSVSGTISCTWGFTDGDGTSSITFHADDGWSYSIDGDHPPATGATGTDVPVIADTNSELIANLELFRHYGRTQFTNADADAICPIIGGAPPSYPDLETKEAAVLEAADQFDEYLGGIGITQTTTQTRQNIRTDTVGGPAQPPVGPPGPGGGDSAGWFIKIRATLSTGSGTMTLPLRALGFVDIAILCDDGSYSD